MNTYWSQYVQKTEELYLSRSLKFHQGNMDQWIDAMQLRDGMEILERRPGAELTGVDLDTGHIDFARRKARELKLQCSFAEGDATRLPFEDGLFDVCYSHTVINFCDPEKFVGEQYRVLKPGGRIVIMNVYQRGFKPEEWIPTDDCGERNFLRLRQTKQSD